ncbi:UDP-glycosyltransferase 74F2 [Bienertia sinuspersici]
MKVDNIISKPHVVVVPYPSQGHINPLLQFAKRLASKDVKATLATTEHTLSSISVLEDVAVEPISDGLVNDGSPQAGSENAFLESFRSNGSSSLARLIENHQNTAFPVTCVVYDAFLPWALDVAKEYGILGAAFFTNSAAVCAIFCCVSHGLIGLPLKSGEVECALPKMPLFKGNDLPTFLRKPESYPAYLAMKLSQFSNLDLADWVFCNSFEDLEVEVLAHEAIGCFVTHCGWNSTLEGISLGVPMVGVPQWSDQLPDAKFIEEIWGVGVWAKEDDDGVVRRENLGECLKEVMEGKRSKEIRESALKLRELSKKTVSYGGSSDKHVEDFVEHLKCTCYATTKLEQMG